MAIGDKHNRVIKSKREMVQHLEDQMYLLLSISETYPADRSYAVFLDENHQNIGDWLGRVLGKFGRRDNSGDVILDDWIVPPEDVSNITESACIVVCRVGNVIKEILDLPSIQDGIHYLNVIFQGAYYEGRFWVWEAVALSCACNYMDSTHFLDLNEGNADTFPAFYFCDSRLMNNQRVYIHIVGEEFSSSFLKALQGNVSSYFLDCDDVSYHLRHPEIQPYFEYQLLSLLNDLPICIDDYFPDRPRYDNDGHERCRMLYSDMVMNKGREYLVKSNSKDWSDDYTYTWEGCGFWDRLYSGIGGPLDFLFGYTGLLRQLYSRNHTDYISYKAIDLLNKFWWDCSVLQMDLSAKDLEQRLQEAEIDYHYKDGYLYLELGSVDLSSYEPYTSFYELRDRLLQESNIAEVLDEISKLANQGKQQEARRKIADCFIQSGEASKDFLKKASAVVPKEVLLDGVYSADPNSPLVVAYIKKEITPNLAAIFNRETVDGKSRITVSEACAELYKQYSKALVNEAMVLYLGDQYLE